MPTLVNLEAAHVLCMGKLGTIKGKGKGKNKDKAKDKSKGRDKGKGKDSTKEDVRVVYLGQDGHVICTAAFGANASRVPNTIPQGQVNVMHLCPKPGQIGLLHWDEQTTVVKLLTPGPNIFPYDTSAVSQDFATWAHIQDATTGEFVALVVSVLSVEYKWTQDAEEPYVVVYGKDTDGTPTGALRLWRFEEEDVQQGSIYIIRGLKVEIEKFWNYDLGKYTPRDDGVKTVEATWRTALEDVTAVTEIARFF